MLPSVMAPERVSADDRLPCLLNIKLAWLTLLFHTIVALHQRGPVRGQVDKLTVRDSEYCKGIWLVKGGTITKPVQARIMHQLQVEMYIVALSSVLGCGPNVWISK